MSDTFNPSTPIYIQLIERIQRQVIRDELHSGDKLPSVRDMAIQSGVNPNTVQRTYRELEYKGIVETRRGQGTFITDNQFVLNNMRQEVQQGRITHFIEDMREMGYTDNEVLHGVKQYLDRESKGDVTE